MRKVAMVMTLTLGAGWAGAQGLPPARANVAPPLQLPLAPLNAADAQGGVPSGAVSAQPVALSLQEAIARGLRQNLAPMRHQLFVFLVVAPDLRQIVAMRHVVLE